VQKKRSDGATAEQDEVPALKVAAVEDAGKRKKRKIKGKSAEGDPQEDTGGVTMEKKKKKKTKSLVEGE
jgi:hypothetical protein